MDVSANITRRDLLAVSFKLLFRVRANLYFMFVLGCGFFAYMWFDEGFASTDDVLIAAVSSIVGAVSGLLAGFLVCVVCMLLTASKQGGVLGMHRFSISAAGLREVTEVNDSHNAWSGVRVIVTLRSHIAILMKSHAAHIVPRRAFASHADYEAFLEQARAWKDAACGLQPAQAAR
jgi:hypothetical protein